MHVEELEKNWARVRTWMVKLTTTIFQIWFPWAALGVSTHWVHTWQLVDCLDQDHSFLQSEDQGRSCPESRRSGLKKLVRPRSHPNLGELNVESGTSKNMSFRDQSGRWSILREIVRMCFQTCIVVNHRFPRRISKKNVRMHVYHQSDVEHITRQNEGPKQTQGTLVRDANFCPVRDTREKERTLTDNTGPEQTKERDNDRDTEIINDSSKLPKNRHDSATCPMTTSSHDIRRHTYLRLCKGTVQSTRPDCKACDVCVLTCQCLARAPGEEFFFWERETGMKQSATPVHHTPTYTRGSSAKRSARSGAPPSVRQTVSHCTDGSTKDAAKAAAQTVESILVRRLSQARITGRLRSLDAVEWEVI